MPYSTISSTDIKQEMATGPTNLSRWLNGYPRERTWSPHGGWTGSTPDYFRLSDLVPAIRTRRRKGLYDEELRKIVALDTSPDTSDAPLGDNAGLRSRLLFSVLTPDEKTRFNNVCKRAGEGLAYAFWDRAVHLDNAALVPLLILRPQILKYVLTGDRATLPKNRQGWADLVAGHVLLSIPEQNGSVSRCKIGQFGRGLAAPWRACFPYS